VHLEWWSREDENAAGPEFDSIIFPEEAEWMKVRSRGPHRTQQTLDTSPCRGNDANGTDQLVWLSWLPHGAFKDCD
jgi:hypothetical protein